MEDTVKCVESKESGKIVRKKVGEIEVRVSEVKIEETSKLKLCMYGIIMGHSSSIKEREKSCPALGNSNPVAEALEDRHMPMRRAS